VLRGLSIWQNGFYRGARARVFLVKLYRMCARSCVTTSGEWLALLMLLLFAVVRVFFFASPGSRGEVRRVKEGCGQAKEDGAMAEGRTVAC